MDSLESTRERIKLLPLLDVRCTPKVNHLNIPLVVQYDVLILYVSMDDPVVMEEVDGFCYLREDAADGGEGETCGVEVDVVEEILAAWCRWHRRVGSCLWHDLNILIS
jgi:hypothetical protein